MAKERLNSAVALLIFVITCLIGCDKDREVDLFLQHSSKELTFSWKGEEKGFSITTNGGPWTISSPNTDWITFDVTSGEGKGKRESILVIVPMNRGEARQGKILIRSGGKESEIIVRQEDGRLSFGELFLVEGTFYYAQDIKDTYIRIPYQKGVPGDRLLFSVEVIGPASDGIEPIVELPIELSDSSGEIVIPLSGRPRSTGEVTFKVSLKDNVFESPLPKPISTVILDPNQPHPDAAAFVISGWLAQPTTSDANYEYIQFLALRDINFSDENFAVITCNNAGQTNGEPPPQGWVSGTYANDNGIVRNRTYKFNITSGTVKKGEYFYVGGTSGRINGPNSGANSIPATKWVRQHAYNSLPGDDDVGGMTTNLLANSGLTYGVAVFRGTTVVHDTEPMDVVFLRNPQTDYILFGPVNGEDRGFRVTNTDYYTVTETIRYINQYDALNKYYNVNSVGGAGSTVTNLGAGNFLELRGVYDVVTAKWTTARSRNVISLSSTSVVSAIETPNSTKMTPAP